MGKLRAALIGCGKIGKSHIEAYSKNRDYISLEATCDPMIERAEERAGLYKANVPEASVKSFKDYKTMLAEIKPDMVSIGAESGRHPEIAIDCLNAGVHVITEKPMSLSTADADRMITAAKKNGKKLAICFQNRFNAPVQRLRQAIDAGRFGRLLHGMIQVRWNRLPAYYATGAWRGTWEWDGGALMNQCIHGIDLLQWMLGEDAVRVQAQTRKYMRPIQAEDFGAAIVEFKSGAVGIIEGSACVYPKNLAGALSIFGEKGSAVIGGVAANKMETWRLEDAETVGDTEEKVINPDEKDPPTVYGFGHAAVFRNFVEAVEQNTEPLVTGEKGRKAVELILAIYKSQKTGKAVDLPCDFSTLDMEGYFGK